MPALQLLKIASIAVSQEGGKGGYHGQRGNGLVLKPSVFQPSVTRKTATGLLPRCESPNIILTVQIKRSTDQRCWYSLYQHLWSSHKLKATWHALIGPRVGGQELVCAWIHKLYCWVLCEPNCTPTKNTNYSKVHPETTTSATAAFSALL